MTATLTLTYRQHFSHSMIMIEFPLHYSGADTRASDNSDMNPFMLAIEKGHSDVVKMMMEKDLDLVCLSVGSGSTVTHWALEKGHSRTAFFKVCSLLLAMQFQSFLINPISFL